MVGQTHFDVFKSVLSVFWVMVWRFPRIELKLEGVDFVLQLFDGTVPCGEQGWLVGLQVIVVDGSDTVSHAGEERLVDGGDDGRPRDDGGQVIFLEKGTGSDVLSFILASLEAP